MNLKSIVVLAFSVCLVVSANSQGMFIGPEIGYTLSTSVPAEVSRSGAPTRLRVGASVHLSGKSKVDFRFSLGYRIENGAAKTLYTNPLDSNLGLQRHLTVIEPYPGSSNVKSEFVSNSIDLAAEGFIPLGDLDTSGSRIGLTLGFFADRILSASQTDDYSAIADYPGPPIVQTQYKGQFGFGASIGVSTILPLGDSRIVFDIKYIIRQPYTLITNDWRADVQNVEWLISNGLRISAGYLLPI